MKLRLPSQLEGEERIVKNAEGKSETFIVPSFLSGCRTAVIYARVSSPSQRNNSSFGRQRAACESFAQAAGLKVARHYEEVESGCVYLSRPLLQQALNDIEDGIADVFLVETMDRLVRDARINAEISHRIRKSGGFLIFCEEQRIDSPDQKFLLDIASQASDYKHDRLGSLGLI